MSATLKSSSAASDGTLQVGGWMVEPALNEISASGTTVRLEPKAMAVLAYLAERPGQVVRRETLLEAIWPGVIVGDDSLTQVIIKLRKALGDSPQSPSYIQTVAKGGYRLIAPVARPFAAAASAAPDDADPRKRKPRRMLVTAAAVAVLMMTVLTMVWLVHVANPPAASPAPGFDRTATDLFAIQDELGPKILQLVPAKVSDAELQRLAQRHTRNLQAYEYFQRGQSALLVRQKPDNDAAREMFRRAIELDPLFARAYAAMALTYAADYRNQWTTKPATALDRAFELARTAHDINPDLAETYWALAYVYAQRREHAKALQQLETAVGLYPSFADGYALMGSVNTFAGRPAATIPLLRSAMRLNPSAGHLYFLVLGRAYLFVGDTEQARVNLQQALTRNAESLEAHVYMAATHAAAGDAFAAAWEAEEIRMLQPDFSPRRWLESYPMTDAAQRDRIAQLLAVAGF